MRRRGTWIWRDGGVPTPISPLIGPIDPKLDASIASGRRDACPARPLG